jgi:predicted ATPase/serine/threonine protein kinase
VPLEPGTRIGPYEILEPLGEGGMGQVYRARDTRLKREVALKTLPDAWVSDPERVARLQLEAQAASSLNNPHIVTVHELGSSPPHHYIVMELVDGESVRALIGRAGLAPERLIEIAAQLASALAAAHAKGIVHRDLKPENVMVTREGLVKVLDFGLARVPHGLGDGGADDATDVRPLTGDGVVVGTVAYMSPEQAQGLSLDHRTDQFSLGAMLYEMASGRRPFEHRTAAETIASILRDPPQPLDTAGVPPPLRWVIERCLRKRPAERYYSTRELADELAGLRQQLAAPRPARAASNLSPLPTPRTSLVGREAERATLAELLQRPENRLVTLTGPGGTGKTRLATRVAGDVRDSFPGGVAFVSLAGRSDAAGAVSEIAGGFGLRAAAGVEGVEALGAELARELPGETLLVLDSFERVVQAAPVIATLLTSAPQLKVLVTSQTPLRLYGEREFALPPLPPEGAATLFAERAGAVLPGFAITPENAAAVAAVCARLDGLPLAIELAAARVKLLSPAALAARLERSLDFLTGPRDLPARQQTLRATIDWTHELLSPSEQALFRRLAVFVSGATLEAAEAVADARQDLGVDVLEAMSSLVDKSLLRCRDATAADPRFEMLETVREYALERLAKSGDEALARRAHAAYALVIAEEGSGQLSGDEAPAALARFDQEHANLRAALEHLLAAREVEWATRLATALMPYYRRRELLADGRSRIMSVLALPGASPRARAGALYAASLLAGEQGDGATSRALLEESVELYRELGDERATVVARNALAVACQLMGDLEAAHAHLAEVLRDAERLGDADSLAQRLNNLASVTHASGDAAGAAALYAQCRGAFEARGDRLGAAWALDQQGDATRDAGDPAAARALYEQSLQRFRELDNRAGVATALVDLARLARLSGDLDEAGRRAREVLALEPLGSDRAAVRLLEELAAMAASDRDPRRAMVLTAAAAALRGRLGWPLTTLERPTSERLIGEQRAALGDEALRVWSEGYGMTAEDALRYARGPRV